MNYTGDQAGDSFPKSWLLQFHREEVFTGQRAQMAGWENAHPHAPSGSTGPAPTAGGNAPSARPSLFPAHPWASSWKTSDSETRSDSFAAERVSDKGAYSLQRVRASPRDRTKVQQYQDGWSEKIRTANSYPLCSANWESNSVLHSLLSPFRVKPRAVGVPKKLGSTPSLSPASPHLTTVLHGTR